jgi:hypothetical protein
MDNNLFFLKDYQDAGSGRGKHEEMETGGS